MDHTTVGTSMCTPSHQESLQYQNKYSYQQQQHQQQRMMDGAPTRVASPEHTHRQIPLEHFHQRQHQQQQQQQYEKLRRASIHHTYQLDRDRSQDETCDAIHSQRHPSANWNITKSPTSTRAFNSDNSTNPSENSSKQNSPYMSPHIQSLNHTNNKQSSPPQQGMAGTIPPNTITVFTHDRRPSCYQPHEQYSAGQPHTTAFFQQQQQPRLTTTLWEDEGTLCFQVDARGICVARRQDNDMVNGTKLLNVVGMSRGKRDGILKNEKGRVVVKVGAMHLKGVWITIERAKVLSAQFQILDLLYPLLVDEPNNFLFSPAHPSVFSFSSPSINQRVQGGPSITDQRQTSPLHTNGVTGYTLDPSSTGQPPIPSGTVAAFSANRGINTGAKSNGKYASEIDMYLQYPAMCIDYRGLGNYAGFLHPNGGYSGSLNTASHFPSHSFNGYRTPSNLSAMSRYMTAGGDIFTTNGSIYLGEPNVLENSNVRQHVHQMHCCPFQNQHQLEQNRRILNAMSSESNGMPGENVSSSLPRSGLNSPKPVPSNDNVNSLTFQTPSNGLYQSKNVHQVISNSSEIGRGSGPPPSQTLQTRKRAHENGPGASTHTSCLPGNNSRSPLSVSPPVTPTQYPSGDLSQLDSPTAKRSKADTQALLLSDGLLAQQQFLQPHAEENSEKKQHGQSPTTRNGNGQCLSWTNGPKNNIPSSDEQGEDELFTVEQIQPVQSIPPHLESYRFPETENNNLDFHQSPYEFGDGPLGNSTHIMQQNQAQVSSQDQVGQQQECPLGRLENKAGPLPSINTISEGQFSVLQSTSSRTLNSTSAVGALLGATGGTDTDAACARDQQKSRPSPLTEVQW